MSMAVLSSAAFVPVCSQAGDRLAVFPALRAEREEKAEGKIKETGTPLARFRGKPLSAHCFGAALAAPWFWTSRAATWRKALALQDFERHPSPNPAVFHGFSLEALA